MCSFNEIDESNWLGQFLQILFLSAGCSIEYLGIFFSILLIGFFPFYIFIYLVYSKKLVLYNTKAILALVFSIFFTVLISLILWVSAAILGKWG